MPNNQGISRQGHLSGLVVGMLCAGLMGLGALLNDPAKWDTLVVWDLGRISRSINDVSQPEEWLTANGKTLETVDGLRFPREGGDRDLTSTWTAP